MPDALGHKDTFGFAASPQPSSVTTLATSIALKDMVPSPAHAMAGMTASSVNDNLQYLPEQYGWPTTSVRGYRIKEQLSGTERPIRVVHLGAGASGICFSKFASETLQNVAFCCYDKNPDIGGTWLENRSGGNFFLRSEFG